MYYSNLVSTKEQAHRIALNIREQGQGKEEVSNIERVFEPVKGWVIVKENRNMI